MHFARTTALALMLAAPALAQSEHFDALLLIDPDGALVTGLVDFAQEESLASEQRVFDATFEIIPLGGGIEAATTDVPGFNALLPSNDTIPAGYQTLPANTTVSFDARAFEVEGATANLFFWDGNGAVAFAPASIVTNISKAPSVLFSVDLDGGVLDVPGFDIDTSNSSGGLHKHVDFTINNSQNAPEGVYLWSFILTAGALEAEPVYFVHALGPAGSAAQQQAADWVQDNLVDEAPLCAADFDGDNDVDLTDFGTFGAAFGSMTGDANYNTDADFDDDGDVDLTDFGTFGSEFGSTPTDCAG